jgi:hypothetical protein
MKALFTSIQAELPLATSETDAAAKLRSLLGKHKA